MSIYRDVRQLTCTNVMCGGLHIANVFQHTDGRWYYSAGTDGRYLWRTCDPAGYATFAEARAAVIDADLCGSGARKEARP